MGDMFCGQCGARKRPLAFTTYCPNDCDRLVPRREPAVGPTCPGCGSTDTEQFRDCEAGNWHCNPCGDVWWVDGPRT